MTRARNGLVNKARHKKILKLAKGFRGRAKNCFRTAVERVEKALQYAYRDRRTRKRDFRGLWIQRINAAARLHGITYSELIHGLTHAEITIDRKILSDLAISEPDIFKEIVLSAKKALASKPVTAQAA